LKKFAKKILKFPGKNRNFVFSRGKEQVVFSRGKEQNFGGKEQVVFSFCFFPRERTSCFFPGKKQNSLHNR